VELLAALETPRYLRLLERLDRATLDASVDDDGPTLAELAHKEFKRLKKRVRRLPEQPTDDDLHDVRIFGKRARYAAEFAAPTMARDATEFVRRAKGLQDVLGEHQDSCIAEVQIWQLAAAVRDTDAAFAAGVVVERERGERRRAREKFPKAWRSLKHAASDLCD
jgi:CHAD domain-containing protein